MNRDLKTIFGSHHGLDEKSMIFLVKALEKHNLPGFDYIEFKQSLGALQAMDMDETVAFKSAFVTASTMGLTREKLLKTAAHYKSILDQEKQQFDTALQKQIEQRVHGKLTEVEKLRKKIEEYRIKIKELEEKIARSQNTIDSADENIRRAKERILSTKESFEMTYQSIQNQIDKDIENIKMYL